MKCPFSFPKRKIKNSIRCQYIKYDGVQCRNYQVKSNALSENHLFCGIHCRHGNTEIIFNKDHTPKTIICRFYRNCKLVRKFEKKVKYPCKYSDNMDATGRPYNMDATGRPCNICCVVHNKYD